MYLERVGWVGTSGQEHRLRCGFSLWTTHLWFFPERAGSGASWAATCDGQKSYKGLVVMGDRGPHCYSEETRWEVFLLSFSALVVPLPLDEV